MFSFTICATEIFVTIDGVRCNISGECYDKRFHFDFFQVEDALAESKVCYTGSPSGILTILKENAAFSEEYSYLEVAHRNKYVKIAYFDAFMHEQEEGGQATVESILYCTVATIEFNPCSHF